MFSCVDLDAANALFVQDTVTGFLLAGVGATDSAKQPNYLIVDSSMCLLRVIDVALLHSVADDVGVSFVAHVRCVRLIACCTETKHSDIEAAFKKFSTSPNCGILLISQPVTSL